MTVLPARGWPKEYGPLAVAAGKASWQAWCEEIEAERGHSICGRKTRSRSKAPGTPCPLRPGPNGTGACRFHGDRQLAGEAAPGYKHGRDVVSARGVGRSLRERLEEGLEQDPRRMMALGATVLLARFDELVERIDTGSGGPETIARARELLAQMRAAGDPAEMGKILRELEEVIRAGAGTDAVWADEFYRLINLMGLHAERHRKVMEAAGEYVERSRAVMLFQKFGEDVVAAIMASEIPDEMKAGLRRKIAGIILGYLNRKALPAVTSAA